MRRLRILGALFCTILSTTTSAQGLDDAHVPLAERAGVWEGQRIDATFVAAGGAKVGTDLGPARAAALGHLDGDGVLDLVVVHGSKGRCSAVVMTGDPRFRFGPRHDLERERLGLPPERPFKNEGVVYDLPFVPDWVAVGDWDADGDFDVVFAARDRAELFWMAGDGRGNLIFPSRRL